MVLLANIVFFSGAGVWVSIARLIHNPETMHVLGYMAAILAFLLLAAGSIVGPILLPGDRAEVPQVEETFPVTVTVVSEAPEKKAIAS